MSKENPGISDLGEGKENCGEERGEESDKNEVGSNIKPVSVYHREDSFVFSLSLEVVAAEIAIGHRRISGEMMEAHSYCWARVGRMGA